MRASQQTSAAMLHPNHRRCLCLVMRLRPISAPSRPPRALGTRCRSLWAVMDALPAEVRAAADHLAVDGMSATALLVDARGGAQLTAPMLYNESQPADVVAAVKVPMLTG